MSSRAPIGYLAIAANPLSTNQGFKSFPPSSAWLPEYLFYFLAGNRGLLQQLASGSTFPEVSGRKAAEIPIPIAPIAEQRRIVAALEEHLSRLDSAVAGLRRVEGQLLRYRTAVLKAAFEKDLPTAPLGRVASVQLGKMLSAKSRTGRGARPYLRNVNVRWGAIELDDLREMDFTDREVEKYSLAVGDILVCEGGEPGRAAIWRGERADVLYQKALHRVRVDTDSLLPEYLVHQFRYLADSGRLSRGITGSTIQHLPLEDMVELRVAVPPIEIQRLAVDHVDGCLTTVGAIAKEVATGLAYALRLRQAILRQAFEGQLVPQDPNDEPADQLLARVRAARETQPTPQRGVRRSVRHR
jgi:type I restriction enzyme S subunit